MKWALSSEFESKKVNGPRDFARVLGAAFTAGMAFYNEWRRTAPTPAHCPSDMVDAAVQTAIFTADVELRKFEGRVIGERDEAQRTAILPRTERAVRRAIAADPIPPEWQVILVEQTLGEAYGWAKPDLVVYDPRGIAPVDYKLKLTIRGKSPDERRWNKDQLVADFSRSWQMYHYCWALGLENKADVTHYNIALVVLEPSFSIELLPYEIDPESLRQWETFAVATWARMEQIENGEAIPVCGMDCGSRYGPCEFQKMCWDFHYDWEQAKFDYVRRKHRERT